jgi:hypothetical protein
MGGVLGGNFDWLGVADHRFAVHAQTGGGGDSSGGAHRMVAPRAGLLNVATAMRL